MTCIYSISALNDADFAGALSEYIKYFNTSREFFVVVNGLNATERNEYRYKVTVSVFVSRVIKNKRLWG